MSDASTETALSTCGVRQPHLQHPRVPELAAEIGALVKAWRVANDMKQAAFAAWFGVSSAAVSQWESGQTVPRAELLITLMRVCSFDVRDLTSAAAPVSLTTTAPDLKVVA
jgi:transcriptional regulator with XRE-family HTH domain